MHACPAFEIKYVNVIIEYILCVEKKKKIEKSIENTVERNGYLRTLRETLFDRMILGVNNSLWKADASSLQMFSDHPPQFPAPFT